MTETSTIKKRGRSPLRRWISRGFLLWAVFSTLWMANSVRTQGVDAELLQNSSAVIVKHESPALSFLPISSRSKTGLIFICGSGIAAEAYAPLLRPLSESGYPVFIVRLPYRFAPFDSHKLEAIERVRRIMATHSEVPSWVVSGHSLGGALACRVVQGDRGAIAALVLIGTTHPKADDLSRMPIAVTKVFGSNDGIATRSAIETNRKLLPDRAKWIEIQGANHSQFGHYGHQFLDGKATIGREKQQTLTRQALRESLIEAEKIIDSHQAAGGGKESERLWIDRRTASRWGSCSER